MTTGHKGMGERPVVYEEGLLLSQFQSGVGPSQPAQGAGPVLVTLPGLRLPVMVAIHVPAGQVDPRLTGGLVLRYQIK